MASTILVVGAGQMGAGIAQVCAESGLTVYITDINHESAQKGLETIKHFLYRKLEKGKFGQDRYDDIVKKITVVDGYSDAGDADFVIEVASENLDIKKKIFSTLDKQMPPHTIFASNTSTFSITALSGATKRPEKVIGMHFFIPAPVMKLVEIIPGLLTGEDTLRQTFSLAQSLGKKPVKAPDTSAFLVNRLLVPMWNEAAYLVMEGNDPKDVDTAMKLGANLPMGPCELADFAGLDTALSIMTEMYESFSDPKYRPCPLLKKMVAAGLLGRKSGRGFYQYSDDRS
ncbi:MAG: 3-hydroxyacyl-CoA dehydrogenase NAD-binding domain-containing protein [Christensenella sp.]|uniref:3-hydroxyacyl-CoA dehydrogenase family protein n=1 Tax=Christensenella sp. TaxID=1935934 RepID=UPI002B1FCB96|nr:3-hydroxyacyl-CoA dehydrogenase NAD-binding domain-containing protein [Christensenella sp.]MEA5002204.1 3-hydroxyacyl-CoA dehydrogenase NAD-binding domain-containing protein [Christensenella sp.]